jgi:peptidoglycan hydrolase-like protein with peptidoglycan-binding domain
MVVASVLFAGLAFWAGTAIHASSGALPQKISEPRPTVPVGDEVLTESVQGTGVVALPAGDPVTPLTPELSGPGAQPVITGFPWHVGAIVDNADVLAEVAGQPIFIFAGATPVFRDLETGESGKDVSELQVALRAAGYPVDDPSGYFGSSTAGAVAALYSDHGYSAPTSSEPSTATPSGRPKGSAGARLGTDRRAPMLPVWSAIFVDHLPATVSAVHAGVGERVNGSPLLDIASGALVAEISVEPSIPVTLRSGMEVKLSASSGESFVGRVISTPPPNGTSSVSPSSSSGAASSGTSTAGEPGAATTTSSSQAPTSASEDDVVVSLPRHVRLPAGSPLDAVIVRASSRERVLVVPVSAVQASADGGYYLEVERQGKMRRVAVQEGMTAAGNAAVRAVDGSVLRAGEPVAIPN